jgi:carbamate kinase
MRIVAALGGNALLERYEPPEAGIQEAHVVTAVRALAPLAAAHDLVITHGNGPQVGMIRPSPGPTRSTCSARRPRA